MTNPIQEVLDAQARAQEEIAAARRAAEERLVEARASAAVLQARNAERTRRAIRHAETRSEESIEREIGVIEEEARNLRERFLLMAERNLDDLVERTVDELWPTAGD
jgi:hypothetical protein